MCCLGLADVINNKPVRVTESSRHNILAQDKKNMTISSTCLQARLYYIHIPENSQKVKS